jgi:hypothetical protein
MAYTGTASLDVYSGIKENTGISVAALNDNNEACMIYRAVNKENIHIAKWLTLEQF